MINKAECYALALQEVKTMGHIAKEKASKLREQLLNDHAELARLEKEMIALSQKKMQAAIHTPKDLPLLEQKYTQLKQLQKKYLTTIGLDGNAFLPQFRCINCQDSGITERGTCDCVKKIANQKMLQQLCNQFPIDDFSFETFSLSYYEGEELEKMKENYEICRNYVNKFHKHAESLYILGHTGLGKTHLTFSMAKEIVAKGYSVIYCTAQNMISTLEKEHFGNTETPVQEYYLNCDLLIIDDLGTEFLSPVAQSELYHVINHRILLKLPTIINSNLEGTDLEKRYGERIVSRIFGFYQGLRFVGNDVRIQKRVASKNFKNIKNNT